MATQQDNTNTIFTLAVELVNNTNQSIFLTGKAGTGKTTFLKHIKENTIKNTVVVAPTGVAAINAGGVTMHSFFQLPFSPYIPQSHSGSKFGGSAANISDKHTLFKNIKFNNDKRKLINELQLLIIDEISMVRADVLDAIDAILRQYRRTYHLPFGGVQVLLIGDMYQLPPVVPEQEWQLLEGYYETPFFFSAQVMQEHKPLYIELKKIYRQTDQQFIDILNRIRNNHTTNDDLEILNDLYVPESLASKNTAIVLTTHNYKANNINEKELAKLNTSTVTFKGEVKGDFNDKLLPNDMELQLKEGAQIMFIKNDSSTEKKYYNGKLATINKIEKDKITAVFENDITPYELKTETWKNIRYSITDANEIEENELGSYTQYPIRLAWAITIHKSQGLTFEKIIIDAGQSFAAGQVYVALSRCTSLQGLTLQSKIDRTAINTDARIIAFAKEEAKEDELQRVLTMEKDAYMQNQLIQFFSFTKMIVLLEQYKNLIPTKKIPEQEKALSTATSMYNKAIALNDIAIKFQTELKQIFTKQPIDLENIKSRTNKALLYFSSAICNYILQPLQLHSKEIGAASKIKIYLATVKKYETELWTMLQKLNQASYNNEVFVAAHDAIKPYDPKLQQPTKAPKSELSSAALSFEAYKKGMSIPDIAKERYLAESTIEGHLSTYLKKGEIPISYFVTDEKLETILAAIERNTEPGYSAIKQNLGDNYTFAEIRAVTYFKEWAAELAKN